MTALARKRKAQRRLMGNLYRRQRGRCAWCWQKMLPPGEGKREDGSFHDRACTVDHLDCRLSEDRGEYSGEVRKVAACWLCNQRRGQMQQAMLTIEELRERAAH